MRVLFHARRTADRGPAAHFTLLVGNLPRVRRWSTHLRWRTIPTHYVQDGVSPWTHLEHAVHLEALAQARITSADGSITQKRAVLDQRRTLLNNARIVAPFAVLVVS